MAKPAEQCYMATYVKVAGVCCAMAKYDVCLLRPAAFDPITCRRPL